MRPFPRTAHLGLAVIGVTAGIGLAACGSSSSTSPTTTAPKMPSASIATQTKDAAAAALVPTAVASMGTLTIATHDAAAPLVFSTDGGASVVGMDIDMTRAIAQTLGLTPVFHIGTFSEVLPAVNAGTDELGAGAITITPQRETKVDFVEYFRAGQSIFGKASTSNPPTTLAAMCGHTVAAVPKASIEQAEMVAQSAACTAQGHGPITVLSFDTQSEITAAVTSGQAIAGFTDTPIVVWTITQAKEKLVQYGTPFKFAPYGVAVNKNSGLAPAIKAAFTRIQGNGTYAAILTKWGLASGAASSFPINP